MNTTLTKKEVQKLKFEGGRYIHRHENREQRRLIGKLNSGTNNRKTKHTRKNGKTILSRLVLRQYLPKTTIFHVNFV